jgi:hypothetical protein
VTQAGSGPQPPAWCEHGPGGHDGGMPSSATAPSGAGAWLLIESAGPWAAEALETPLPAPLGKLAIGADELGIRVQLIRRPVRPGRPGGGSRSDEAGRDGEPGHRDDPAVYTGWTAGPAPWLRRMPGGNLDPAVLGALAAGEPAGGMVESGPLFLVCAHGRRDRCCARFGVPLARELAARYPGQVWETTHVGGHRFAANLVILPHGLYYGPVDSPAAHGAIDAYQRGEITAHRYRGRAGQDTEAQEAERTALATSGTLRLVRAGSPLECASHGTRRPASAALREQRPSAHDRAEPARQAPPDRAG